MAVPFRRTSKRVKRERRSHIKLTAANLATCSNCKAQIIPHRVCKHCGFYKGKKVMDVKIKD